MTAEDKAWWGSAALAAAAVATIVLGFGSGFPPSWPDEFIYTEPARALVAGQGFGTPALAGQVPGIERTSRWITPLYPLLAAGPIAAGAGLGALRFLSLACVLGAIAVLARGYRERGVPWLLAAAGLIAFAVDPLVARAGNIARMEAPMVLCAAGALVALGRAGSPRAAFAAGALGAATALLHPLGLSFCGGVVIAAAVRAPREGVFAALGAAAALAPYGVFVLTDLEATAAQYGPQLARKTWQRTFLGLEGVVRLQWIQVSSILDPARLLVLLGLLACSAKAAAAAGRAALVPLIVAGFTTAGVLFGREIWYPPLALVTVHAAIVLTPGHARAKAIALAVAAALNLAAFADSSAQRRGWHQIEDMIVRASDAVPPGSTVWLDAVPDCSFVLHERGVTVRMPIAAGSVPPERLAAAAAQCDYVLIGGVAMRSIHEAMRPVLEGARVAPPPPGAEGLVQVFKLKK